MQPEDIDIVARALADFSAPMLARIAALERQLEQTRSAEVILPMAPAAERGEPGPQGVAGPAGKDVDIEEVIARLLPLIPVPKDGQDGKPGQDGVSPEPVDVEAIAKAAAALISVPKDGQDGADAKDVDIEAVAKMAAALIPAPRDGRDGMPGGLGRDGKDATVDLEAVAKAAAALIPIPRDGRDGSLEQLKVVRQDERTLIFCFKDGTPIEGGTITLGHPVFKDTYRDDAAYKSGDLVQYSGCGWIALKDDPAMRPGAGTPEVTGWRLFIKKGADGRVGPEGKAGPQGPRGEQGPQGPKVY